MSVGEICNREVVFAFADESVAEAARRMRDYHVGDLVVVEERSNERFPVGIVTDRDLVLEVMAVGADPDTVAVREVMSTDLVFAREQDSLFRTIKRMRHRGIRRIPVVNGRGGLEGILSADDVIDLLAEQLGEIGALLRRQPGDESAHHHR